MTVIECKNCKYYLGDLSCVAFGDIPADILNGAPHHEVREHQDADVVFEPKVEGEDDFEPELA